jgi:CBS domain-containing protein
MIRQVFTASPDDTIGDVLNHLSRHRVSSMPVVDDNNIYQGMIGLTVILNHLLPVAVRIDESGLDNLEFVHNTSDAVRSALNKMVNEPVSDHMDGKQRTVHPNTPTWEAIRVLVKHGRTIPVVDKETHELKGILSRQCILSHLKDNFDFHEPAENDE